jgi:hypothetical protein
MEPNTYATERKGGHHQVAAALFVGSLILGASLILSAELTKPPRYEYHSLSEPSSYLIFDNDNGRTTIAKVDSKSPTEQLEH